MINTDKQSTTNCRNFIKECEGVRLMAYLCPAGIWTIGYGHTAGVHPGMQINMAQASQFFLEDIAIVERVIQNYVTVVLTQGQFDALCSFVYNIGSENFRNSTLLRLLNQKKYNSIPAQFKRWVHGEHGEVLEGLVKRRDEESQWWGVKSK